MLKSRNYLYIHLLLLSSASPHPNPATILFCRIYSSRRLITQRSRRQQCQQSAVAATEMAAYAALASLMNNIEQMMKHPHLHNSFNNKQIQTLLANSGFLLDIIKGSKYVGGSSGKAEDFERQITSAAYAAEDVIESHIVDLIHVAARSGDEETSSSHVQKKMRKHVIESPELQRITEDMEGLMEKVNEVMKLEREDSTLPLMEISGKPITAMVGLDDELNHLLDELTGHQSNRHTISIVGMGGMGKTTLARNLYANPLIVKHFDVRAWAAVSQHFDALGILSQLLSSLGIATSGSVGELGEKLHKALIGRRYLVILDDIWSVDAWDKVRHYLPNDGQRSRVVVTTRLSNVAIACGSSCFTMNLLDEGKSWKLFCEKALFPHKDDPLELEDVGKEIVGLCKGLALSIVVIGGLLLKSPRTIRHWEDVAHDLKSTHNSKEKQESLDVLSLSYSQLPPHLKPCFLYMGVFREDSEIRVSYIIRLWVAEGFIRTNATRVVLEEIAEGCLKDLIERNLVFINRRRANGDVGSCGIHDLLRDLCIKVAEQQEFFHLRGKEIRSTDRRVVDPGDLFSFGSRLLRSISLDSLNVKHKEWKLMRVLDYSKCEFGHSQDELYEYVNARYVASGEDYKVEGMTWNLPSSVSLVWNLQTLMISASGLEEVLVVAPSQIWNLRQFRHITYPKIYLPPPSNGEDIMENFQTLTTAVNLRLSEEVCNIVPNIKKLYLQYDRDLVGYDDRLMECVCNLDRLIKLESLKIALQMPYIRYGWELPKKLAFPSSLRKLSLLHCGLHWNDMSMIGSLPRLQALHLNEDSVTEGEVWSPNDGQFRQLKFLMVDSCSLHHWKADNSHFPVLEKLHLIYVFDLKEIPLDIGDISTLELIRVVQCDLSVAISAMRIKEYQQDLGNDGLQIKIEIDNSEVTSFMEMVETEHLTLNNIQLSY